MSTSFRQHTFVFPSAFSRRAVVSYWRKYVNEVLVNRLGGLSLPRKSVVRLTDRPDMTLDVNRGRKKQCNNATSQDRKSPMQHRPGSKPGFRCQAIVRQLYSLSFIQDLASSQCCSERLLLYRYTVSNAPNTWLHPRVLRSR